ncbi:MAG TPA: DUF4424 family protein [Sphingomicrobium sp.]|nr:DUF4424 family protein [Sphingomicrobium sp.]
MRRILLLAPGLALASAALANDSTASSAAGGLILQRTDAIDMVSEDLFVSAKEIRVSYVFRNRTPRDVETVVAFPMPDHDLSQDYGQDRAYPSGFRTRVAGQPVKTRIERRAVLKGKDYTALLRQYGIPLLDGPTSVMDRLPAANQKRLVSLGLAGDEEYDDTGKGMKHHLIPLWTVKETHYWTQRFPAGRDLAVDHRYVPGRGGSVDTILNSPYVEKSDPERRAYIARYCIDREFLAGVQRMRRTNQVLPNTWIDYILTTGANWRSPIGSFRLVIDKGRPQNLISFCESGVKKIGPTQYEVRHKNWRPTRDLHVLIIHPGAWEM